jgi:protein-S-isoprenylcysteine O-methyltransferase Ste14
MERLNQQKNRGYLIAGIGAIVALLAFLFLPYISYSVGPFGGSIGGTQVAGSQGLIWLEALLPLAAIALTSLLVYRSNPFGMTTTPIATQIRWGVYSILGAGVLSLILHFILALNANGSIQAVTGNPVLGSLISVGFGIGYWLYLLAAIAIIVGAVLTLRMPMSTFEESPLESSQQESQIQRWPPSQQ